MLCGRCPRSRPRPLAVPRSAAPPLIGVVTHELLPRTTAGLGDGTRPQRARPRPAAALDAAVLHPGGAGGGRHRGRAAGPRLRGRHGRAARPLDGLLVSGGPDLDPAVYGQARHPALGPDVDRVSDEYELALLAGAAERDLPLLGICRGLQALNVVPRRDAAPASPGPHRRSSHLQRTRRSRRRTPSTSTRGSLLHWLTGSRRPAVNSFHHQAADRIGAGLEVCARAPDGTVEALWDPAASFCLGVQWHAELLTHRAEQATLLQGLVDAACGARPRSSRSPPDAACQHLKHGRLYPSRQRRDP